MSDGDFFSSEQSYIMPNAGSVNITLHQDDGTTKVLKEGHPLQAGEVIDASKFNIFNIKNIFSWFIFLFIIFLARLSVAALCEFFEQEIQDCFDKKLMMSLHMKATMMKV